MSLASEQTNIQNKQKEKTENTKKKKKKKCPLANQTIVEVSPGRTASTNTNLGLVRRTVTDPQQRHESQFACKLLGSSNLICLYLIDN